MSIRWSRPQPMHPSVTTDKIPVVYLVLWRCDTIPEWRKADMTSDLHTTIKGDHSQYSGIQFLLVTTSSRGVVADVNLNLAGKLHLHLADSQLSTLTLIKVFASVMHPHPSKSHTYNAN